MFGMGASELMIILVIILLLFGAAKLPELGRSLGSGLSNFKKGLKDGDEPEPPPKVAVRVEEPARTRLDPPAPAPAPPSDAKDS
jgi:sec-independent protein translocase protein TatA